jgi:DNA-binding NtrC family response regulator
MFSTLTLLFVDEGPAWLVEIREFLEAEYSIVAVETGPQALAKLENQRVSVLITDSHLASVQDRRFSQSLQQHHTALPRVVLSDRPWLELAIAQRNGDRVDAALARPCSKHDLRTLIERITGEATVPRGIQSARGLKGAATGPSPSNTDPDGLAPLNAEED